MQHQKQRQVIKVAEHSFRTRFCWCNSTRAQGLQKTNMPLIERSFYLLNTGTIRAIFLYNWTQCIDGFSLSLQRYVRKGNGAKNPAILSFLFVTERTQLNAAHAQLLEKFRPIAFAETCRLLRSSR